MNAYTKLVLIVSIFTLTACGGGISNLWATQTPTPTETSTPTTTPSATPTPTPSSTPSVCPGQAGFIEFKPGEQALFAINGTPFAVIEWDGESLFIQTKDEIQIFFVHHDGRYTIEVSVEDPEGGEVAMSQIPVWVCLEGNFYIDSTFLEKEEKNA